MMHVAHVGDSRIVLAKRAADNSDNLTAFDLTKDHKPDDPAEKARIEANGGRVVFDGFYNHRIYAKGKRYPGLNMSRALGDLLGYYDAGLCAVPDVKSHEVVTSAPNKAATNGSATNGAAPGSPAVPNAVLLENNEDKDAILPGGSPQRQ